MEPVSGAILNQGGDIASDSALSQGLILFTDDAGDVRPGHRRKTGRQAVDNCTDNDFFFRFAHHASVARGRTGVNQSREPGVLIGSLLHLPAGASAADLCLVDEAGDETRYPTAPTTGSQGTC